MNGRIIGGAVIGYGGMGHFHGDKMRTVDGIRLAGIYDIDPERCKFAESEGIHAYTSRAELLADPEIELVVVATPNDVHKEIALDAFAAGKNVISEKPVAMDSAELEEMIAAANRAGKLFTVHQNRRWDEDYLTVKKMVDSHELGSVFRIESRVMGSRGIPSGWREEKEHGGGMLLDWGVHLLDQMLMMMEGRKLLSVHASMTHITNPECDDGFTAFCTFEGGLEWIVEVGTCHFVEVPRWYVFGDAGSSVIRNWACEGEVVKIFNRGEDDVAPIQAGAGITRTMAPRNERTVKTFPVEKVSSDWAEFYKNVIAVLNGKAKIVVTHDQLRACMKLIEAIFESARTGKPVVF